MRFSKKINIAKENRKLGSDFMSSGSIRALNTNEVQSGEKKNESDDADLFKKVENFKVGNSREPDQGNKAGNPRDQIVFFFFYIFYLKGFRKTGTKPNVVLFVLFFFFTFSFAFSN